MSDAAAEGLYAELRILELGSGAAGPLASRYFAEQGATVVRLESERRPDFLRLLGAPGAGLRDREAMDRAPLYALLNPDKRSVALDLQTGEGLALARRLVGWADVVTENFAPGVMARLGLDPEALCAEHPRLVLVSSSLFGQTGPQRDYPGFGGQGAAIAGFNHLTGAPDAEAHGPYGTITDTLSPRYVALLVAAALLERERTGRGQRIDLSQIEAGVYTLSEAIVRQSATGRAPGRRGNRSEHAAPHDAFPTAGDDRWVVIAVHSDAEWVRLRRAMGEPAWAGAPRWDTAAGRLADEDTLGRHIAAWTRSLDAEALVARLREAGVEAGVVQEAADLLRDPQLAHRGHFQPLEHALLGSLPTDRAGFRLASHPGGFRRAAPRLGEHSADVLAGALGLSAEEIARLEREGVLR